MSMNQQFFESNPELSVYGPEGLAAYETIRDAYQFNGILLMCGNGGSAAASEHTMGELYSHERLVRCLDLRTG